MMNFLFDIDGVLLQSFEPLPGAGETIDACKREGIPYLFLTNTTLFTAEEMVERLLPVDQDVTGERVVTPARVAREVLIKEGLPCSLYLPENLKGDFAGVPTGDPPSTLVLGDLQDEFTPDLLTEIFRQLLSGATLLTLHKSRYWQYQGEFHLDLGAWVALLEYASNTQARVVGKPSPDYFRAALSLLGSDASDTVMVGDDIENDIGGARDIGMKTVLVKTGKYRKDHVNRSGITPDHIIDSIADLPGIFETKL